MSRRRGFTLVELLVVIAIIGVLIALLLPAIQAAREAARRIQCSNRIKQIALAAGSYESAYSVYPPGRAGYDGNTTPEPTRVGTSGLVLILPQLEQQAVYDMFDFRDGPWAYSSTWHVTSNGRAIGQRPTVFVCPTDECEPFAQTPILNGHYGTGDQPAATGSYALVAGTIGAAGGLSASMKYENDGIFFYVDTLESNDVTDGLSHTLFAGEVINGHLPDSSNIWSRSVREMDTFRTTSNPLNTFPREPIYITNYGLRVNGAFSSMHPGGANFAFGDGHVAFLEENIPLRIYRALSTRDGGEVIDEYE